MKLDQRYIRVMIVTLLFLYVNCKVDLRQLPPPRDPSNLKISSNDSPIYIGKFEVFTADRLDYLKAWQHTFKSTLQNNRVFSDVRDASNGETLNSDALILDVEISPTYNDSYNYWWTWPAIYPMVGYWPVQMRTGAYSVTILYTIHKDKKIILQSEISESNSETINLYGFYRTSEFEAMIETTNLRALDKCAKDIIKKFSL